MEGGALAGLAWLALVERELLLFAGVFFLIGALDDVVLDLVWLWLRLTGRVSTPVLEDQDLGQRDLGGRAAIFIPAWREDAVIGQTIAHALAAWPQPQMLLYVGCYANDPATLAAAMRGARADPRVRLVVLDQHGPTTKAGCLNALYAAMVRDEARCGRMMRMVVLHDAEDMVDPAALVLLDEAIGHAEFVQLPVLPLPQPASRWIGSHYCEEFAEAHGKAMVVRSALGTGLPAAGVGCAFERQMLGLLARESGADGPFTEHALTEDYELGLRIHAAGGRSRFVRVRASDGRLVATRAYFPDTLPAAVRQKARWVHGIALQGWDDLGWGGGLAESWMRLRDRRGPLSALVLAMGYVLLVVAALSAALTLFGYERVWEPSGLMWMLMAFNLGAIVWRTGLRFVFTAREHGPIEGLFAILRIPVTNVIAIMAGRRALFAYIGTFAGIGVHWDKTAHHQHPAAAAGTAQPADPDAGPPAAGDFPAREPGRLADLVFSPRGTN